MTQRQTIDGFDVRCTVLKHDDRFRAGVITAPKDGSAEAREWSVPGDRCFDKEEEAERYGRYVLLGIQGVRPSGEPLFTVV